MSEYWNSRVRGLEPYVPGEQPRDKKFIKLNTNENPYPPSPKVIEAIKEAAASTLRLYPDPACTVLREEAAASFGVKPEQVFAGNGSDEILAFAFAAFFESSPPEAPGTNTAPLLFPDITYSFYPVYARLWNIPYRAIPLKNDFSIDYRDYLLPSGGAVIANPNAPTGRGLSTGELLAIAEYMEHSAVEVAAVEAAPAAAQPAAAAPPNAVPAFREDASAARRSVLIVDEAYMAFAGAAGVESAVPHIETHPNILTVHTLSKAFSLAGLRVGFAIGGEELIQGLCRVRDSFNSYPLDRLAQAGAAAALADRAYYDGINQKITATRERCARALEDLGFEVIPSQANFIFIRHPKKSGAELFSMLKEKGILVRHFNKPRIADYIRVSIGSDEEMDVFLRSCAQGATK